VDGGGGDGLCPKVQDGELSMLEESSPGSGLARDCAAGMVCVFWVSARGVSHPERSARGSRKLCRASRGLFGSRWGTWCWERGLSRNVEWGSLGGR
jgi:hypothetical protein